jgi:predicted alpha/beta hydrolase family esterase
MATALVIVPGLGNSGPEHWQSHWQRAYPAAMRVEQSDWQHPSLREWIETLDATVRNAGAPAVIAAHSLGCALLAHWATLRGTARERAARCWWRRPTSIARAHAARDARLRAYAEAEAAVPRARRRQRTILSSLRARARRSLGC